MGNWAVCPNPKWFHIASTKVIHTNMRQPSPTCDIHSNHSKSKRNTNKQNHEKPSFQATRETTRTMCCTVILIKKRIPNHQPAVCCTSTTKFIQKSAFCKPSLSILVPQSLLYPDWNSWWITLQGLQVLDPVQNLSSNCKSLIAGELQLFRS